MKISPQSLGTKLKVEFDMIRQIFVLRFLKRCLFPGLNFWLASRSKLFHVSTKINFNRGEIIRRVSWPGDGKIE